MVSEHSQIEIGPGPVDVRVETGDGLPRATPREEMPELTDAVIRDAIDSGRR